MHQTPLKAAAQYIRMSTETQTLSPAMQKQAISRYVLDAGLTLVESYEDEARSGLSLKNRPEMRRLLKDVATEDCHFSVVLVYDVSRWGRFQDTDESAYYEYHCRLHGVEVVYVNELFDRQRNPMTTLLKAFKRTMAAEFSRELSLKVADAQRRALALGYQIGRTPCIGIDRLAISVDTRSSRSLNNGERARKQERVGWIRGPDAEVDLVRRIFDEYAKTDITLAELARKLNREGHTARGNEFSLCMIKCIIDCEIFYGEFTWGRRKSGARSQRRSDQDPRFIRVPSVLDPIVPRQLWDLAQAKRQFRLHVFQRSKQELIEELKSALIQNPSLSFTDMTGFGCTNIAKYREKFGGVREAMRLAGRDEAAARAAYLARKSRTHRLSHLFGCDLLDLLQRAGFACSVRQNAHQLVVNESLRLRFKVVWQREHRRGLRWHFRKEPVGDCDFILLVLMEEDSTANEFLLMNPGEYKMLRSWFTCAGSFGGVRVRSGGQLVEELRRLSVREPIAAQRGSAA